MQKRWTLLFTCITRRTIIFAANRFKSTGNKISLMMVTIPLVVIALSCGGEQDKPTVPPEDVTLKLNIAPLKTIPTNQPFSFIVYGDPRENVSVHKQLIEAFFSERDANDIAFIVNTGDLVKHGFEKQEWKNYFIDVVQPITATVPYFAALGNHDYGELGACDNFSEVFSTYYKNCDFWYSFVYGNSIFIILDANLMTHDKEFNFPKERAERQYYWLEKTLESTSSDTKIKHKFIFFHEAPFISAEKLVFGLVTYHLDHAETLRKYQIGDNFFLDIFRQYDVDAVFLGHVHYYERWVEQYERDSNQRQITWVTSGGGGAKNEIEWEGVTLALRPPTVLTEEEKNKRISHYNQRAESAEDIANWSLFQGYPTQDSEAVGGALEKQYCIVHVDGDSVWMEVKNTERDVIESATIKENGIPRKLTFVEVGDAIDTKGERRRTALQTGIAGELKSQQMQ